MLPLAAKRRPEKNLSPNGGVGLIYAPPFAKPQRADLDCGQPFDQHHRAEEIARLAIRREFRLLSLRD
jgi:hypothetical protein